MKAGGEWRKSYIQSPAIRPNYDSHQDNLQLQLEAILLLFLQSYLP